LIDVRTLLRLGDCAAAAETTPLSAAMSTARPNPLIVAPQALCSAASLCFTLPICSGIGWRYRLRSQVEVNQRVREMPHAEMAGHFAAAIKLRPQFRSALDKISQRDI
jgi:hypothetical protein